jgi:hypothetical protein
MPAALKHEVSAAGFGAHAKWFTKHMSSQTPPLTASASFFKKVVARKMTLFTKTYFPDELITKDICQDLPELNKVLFGVQQFHITNNHHLVAPVPFGLPEVRYLFDGAYNILGWPMSVVAGETLEEKINAVKSDATAKLYYDKAVAQAEGSWFHVHAEPGTAIVIPPGHLIMMSGSWGIEKENQGGATGLRWGCIPTDQGQLDKVKATLAAIDQSYGRVSDDFAKWKEIVETLDEAKVKHLQGVV